MVKEAVSWIPCAPQTWTAMAETFVASAVPTSFAANGQTDLHLLVGQPPDRRRQTDGRHRHRPLRNAKPSKSRINIAI
jgi:hypothetical protein